MGREWFSKFSADWAQSHSSKVIGRLENDVFFWIGARRVSEIEAPELLTVLRRVEARGAVDTAHRIHQYLSKIFRYAIATGRARRDVAADLQGALPPASGGHFASIREAAKIGPLLRAIDGYQGDLVTRSALRLAPLTFVRPGELRAAEWVEFDFDGAEWRIPPARMKMGVLHPSARTEERPMSENMVNAALWRLGYSTDEMTGHGFRSMASTLLNEQGYNRDHIERQLAHGERNAVRGAYNYAEYLPDRRKMMQEWADYLDTLRNSEKTA